MASLNPFLNANAGNKPWVDKISKTLQTQLAVTIDAPPVSIFEIPKTVKSEKLEAYVPQRIGLGPNHHFQPELYHQMEQNKLTAVKRVLEPHQIYDCEQQIVEKVSENLKEKVFAAKEEVKDTFGIGKEESSEPASSSANDASAGQADNENKQSAGDEDKTQESGYAESAETIFGKVRSGVSSSFQKARDAKVLDMAKKGYNIVRDELNGSPSKRKQA